MWYFISKNRGINNMKCCYKILICIAILIVQINLFSQEKPFTKGSSSEIEKKVNDIVKAMTLEEKIDMLGGINGFFIRPVQRLGIPMICMADGPLGVRNYGEATAFPAGILMAATWNTNLMQRVGEAVGKDARAKGVHIMLAPGVNIYRAPQCGRNFEYFGEDPYLAGKMTATYVRSVQSQGVATTVKHYAGNNQEYGRHTISSDIDERTLQEIYLPAFRAAVVDGGAGAVMTAYNLVNGTYCSQNKHLIKDILKGDWKFDGIVMSDWGGTHDAVAAANAGLDLEMPSGEYMNRKNLIPAIERGEVKMQTIDDKIRRIVRTMFRFGFNDRPQPDLTLPRYSPDSRLVALDAAREGIVLLKNESDVLPLDRSSISSIAIVGPNAYPAVFGGGGSSHMTPFRTVSYLDGIIHSAGEKIKVFYSRGVLTDYTEVFQNSIFYTEPVKDSIVEGLRGEYFSNISLQGNPTIVKNNGRVTFEWKQSSPDRSIFADSFSVRWSGKIKPRQSGMYQFIVKGDDGFRLFLDGKKIIDEWADQSAKTQIVSVRLEAEIPSDIVLEYYENTGDAEISLGWRAEQNLKDLEAVRIAARCDAAIVCVGFNAETESEGADRSFQLSREQEDLISEVACVNKRTIVVVTAGGNIAMTGWLDQVPGLLHTWYSGQEGGTALADILFGDVNPSGKLPASFEKRWEDNPCYNSYYDPDTDKHVKYTEGLFIGYRYYDKNSVEPLFPFGYGLSYTKFEYGSLHMDREKLKKGDRLAVSFDIKNIGSREGAEVAQLYIRDIDASEIRPVKELKGFEKILLKPGEVKTLKIEIDERALSFYSSKKKQWIAEPGKFEALVGSSSKEIKLKGTFSYSK
jgi:beta-glucosidase